MYTYVCMCVYIHIYIYIYMYNLPPFNKKPPLIRNPPLGGTNIDYYQFRRRHDYPLIKNVCFCLSNLPRILKIGGVVVERKNIVFLTTSIRKASDI